MNNMLYYLLLFRASCVYTILFYGSVLVWAGIIAIIPFLTSLLGGFFSESSRYVPKALVTPGLYVPSPFFKSLLTSLLAIFKPSAGYPIFGLILHPYFLGSLIILLGLVNAAVLLNFTAKYCFGPNGMLCVFTDQDPTGIVPTPPEEMEPRGSVKPSNPSISSLIDNEEIDECTPPPSLPSTDKPKVPVESTPLPRDYAIAALLVSCAGVFLVCIVKIIFSK